MRVLEQWIERDLSAEAKAGRLAPVFEVDEAIADVSEILDSGCYPILVGESGVGKTAIVYELVRRVHAGKGPECLAGKRILQLSLQRRAASLPQAHETVAQMQKLVKVLRNSGGKLALFIRDIHLAYRYDLEEQLSALAYTFGGPVLGEGPRAAVETLLEGDEGLRQHYLTVLVSEPGLPQVERILTAWAQDCGSREEVYTPGALEQALTLTHRFLARSRMPRKALVLLRQAAALAGDGRPVTATRVIDRFCSAHRTPRLLVDPAIPLDLGAVERSFARKVAGQAEAIDAVVNMIGMIKAGLSDSSRPLGVLLFVGPAGVGKTYVAQLLAEYLFGGQERVIRLNMADFQEEEDAGVLFGVCNHPCEAQMQGLLTRRLMGCPFGVVLLDEFEKANPKVHDRFLQLIDEGSFINGAGETVSCRSMILIATSNAGAEAHRGQVLGFSGATPASRSREARAALEEYFRFELLNRFDRIVHFQPLGQDEVRMIAIRELQELKERVGIERRGLTLDVDASVFDWITHRGFDSNHGARMMRRTVEQHVTAALADVIVRENPSPGSRLSVSIRDDAVVATVLPSGQRDLAEVELSAVPVGTARGRAPVGTNHRRPFRLRALIKVE